MSKLKFKDDRFPDRKCIPIVHSQLYYVIECTFAEAKGKGILYDYDICNETKDNELGLITYWDGKELWYPYNYTKNNTFTLYNADKKGNICIFDKVTLDTNNTKINSSNATINQILNIHGIIKTVNGNVIDIQERNLNKNKKNII